MNGTIRYAIRPYDTIWMLAQVFNTTVDDIMQLNPGIEPRNLLIGQVVNIRPGYHYPTYTEEAGMSTGGEAMTDQNMDDMNNLFRMLWEQHEMWTIMAIVGLVQGLPQTDLILQRLLRNPVDFANALEPFYGVDAAQEFSDLFTAHLTIATEVVRAAMSGDNNALTDADERWRANVDQIAALLGRINPYWTEEDWDAMLNEHLDLLSTFASDMVAGNYAEAIAQVDVMEAQALEMADMMANGVTDQFPG